MAPPPIPGHGGADEPRRDSGVPGGVPAAPGGAAAGSGGTPGPRRGAPGLPGGGRDVRLATFGQWDAGDRFPPNGWLAMTIDELCGPDRRCPDASDDELTGLLRRWAAVESWAAAGKLGVTAELVRRRALPGMGNRRPAGLPAGFDEGTGHEVAAALSVALPTADNLVGLAVTLQSRLPGIYAALAAGIIDFLRAKIIADETAVLADGLVGQAEALILAALAGKTPGEVGKLAAAAVLEVDPEGAVKRRERAEREDARVRFWREQAGTSAIAGYGLPTDAALAATANISARARQYKKAKLDGTMDQLRVQAYLDMLNGISAPARIAQARAAAEACAAAEAKAAAPAGDDRDDGEPDDCRPDGRGSGDSASGDDESGDHDDHGARHDDSHLDDHGAPDDDGAWDDDGYLDDDGARDGDDRGEDPADDGPGDGGPGSGGPGGPGAGDGDDPAAAEPGGIGPALAAKANLTLPLATLLGLAERPGDAHGLGPLDPALARDLAAAAARSRHSDFCITITSPDGTALAHGCGKLTRPKRGTTKRGRTRHGKAPPGRRPDKPWAFTRRDQPGPPGGYGSWTLTLPDGRELTVQLLPIPVTDCDHRYESPGYQPSDLLKHLVQIRDGNCTFPSCSRHARDSDFEHAIPYHQGGKTCACNGGARSRRCHKVKQSKGWTVTQPQPGWHQWTAPSGRTYTQGPKQYPA